MKLKKYRPELGQMCFGCPSSEFECPEFIEAGLRYLSDEIERIEWNIQQEEYESPVANNGAEYKTDIFEIRAYYWGEDKKLSMLPNFKYNDFEVRWYKHLGRGMSMNKEIDANTYFKIIDKCLKNVRKKDRL